MQDLNDKITGGSLTAPEWNEIPSELQNIIEDMGLVLSSGDLNQLGKAVADYAAAGTFYSETGAADAYVATVIGAKQGLHVLSAVVDGAVVRFRPGNANTGPSTLNVNSLGVKDIIRENGNVLVTGDMVTTRDAIVRWDQGIDDWRLFDFALPTPPIDGAHLTDMGVVATTSGTQFDFTNIPSFVKRVNVVFDGVSLSDGGHLLIQIGDAGGIETSGYTAISNDGITTVSSTAGFILILNGSTAALRTTAVLSRVAEDDWVMSYVGINNTTTLFARGGGSKTLAPGPLTQLRITRTSAGTFDAGQATVFFE